MGQQCFTRNCYILEGQEEKAYKIRQGSHNVKPVEYKVKELARRVSGKQSLLAVGYYYSPNFDIKSEYETFFTETSFLFFLKIKLIVDLTFTSFFQ